MSGPKNITFINVEIMKTIMYRIDSVTPTICELMKIPYPQGAHAEPVKEIIQAARSILNHGVVERAFLYAPDALGEWLYQKYRDEFKPVLNVAPFEVEMHSMLPTYTPVCYGSMFTGMKPMEHGIEKYEKPVLKCESIFDSLSSAGKLVAIVAVRNSSVDLIFRDRPIDYYSEDYDPEVEERVIMLLKEDDYDFILAYHQEYDDVMHRSTPTSPEAIEAFKKHVYSFKRMADTFNERYRESNRLIAFLPDHGTHIDPESGKGSHGTSSKEDVEVRHFWGITRSESQ